MSGNHWEEETTGSITKRNVPRLPTTGLRPRNSVTIKKPKTFQGLAVERVASKKRERERGGGREREKKKSQGAVVSSSETRIKVNYWYNDENYSNENSQASQAAQGRWRRRRGWDVWRCVTVACREPAQDGQVTLVQTWQGEEGKFYFSISWNLSRDLRQARKVVTKLLMYQCLLWTSPKAGFNKQMEVQAGLYCTAVYIKNKPKKTSLSLQLPVEMMSEVNFEWRCALKTEAVSRWVCPCWRREKLTSLQRGSGQMSAKDGKQGAI